MGAFGGTAAIGFALAPFLGLQVRSAAGDTAMWAAFALVAVVGACSARSPAGESAGGRTDAAGSAVLRGMKREEREQILKQGVVSPETPRDRRERDALAEDIRASGLRGRPLRLRLRNFRPAADGYLSALGGPLPFMVRLRTITELTADHERAARRGLEALAATGLDEDAFAAAWRGRGRGVVVRRGQRPDRPAQPVLPGRVAAADGSAHARLRPRRRARTTAAARSMPPGRSSGFRPRSPRCALLTGSTPSAGCDRLAQRDRASVGPRAARRGGTAPGRRARRRARRRASGPTIAPTAQAVFMTPKASVWASPAASARSETSAIPGV